MKVLIIEDDERVVKDIVFSLKVRYSDLEVACVAEGLKGISMVETESPDLVIADTSLKNIDSLDMVSKIRDLSNIPLILLYDHDSDLDRAKCLEAGADDCLKKPVSPIELLARIKALLRRAQRLGFEPEHRVSINGSLTINFTNREVHVAGRRVKLTPIEYRLLVELARNPDRVISIETLLEKVWGPECISDRGFVKQYIYRLRAKLGGEEDKPRFLTTERGMGYRLTDDGQSMAVS
jgi:two-component system KDP operon response regulator KdpE